LRVLQVSKFATGAWSWELKQRAQVAQTSLDGKNPWGARAYRAHLSATNVEENKAMATLKGLFTLGSRPWQVLLSPEHNAMTVRGRAYAFRITSRAGALLHRLLIHRHRQYPWVALRLPWEPSLAAGILFDAQNAVCKGGYCDAWTKDLVAEYNTVEKA
jgi:hypothetical protein